MSVLIKGMEMPRRCSDCELELKDEYELTHECLLLYKGYTNCVRQFSRLEMCPLCGALESHGGLIDVDVVERKHGQWEKAKRRGCVTYADAYAECSVCHGKPIFNGWDMNFCPNCGADMRPIEEGE